MSLGTTIVLCGGSINFSNLPIATNQSNAMIPINGKPVLGWILDDLLVKGITSVVVVFREQDHRLRSFLMRSYGERMQLTLCPLTHEGTIVQSLEAGLKIANADGLVRVILGDTLILDSYESTYDHVYVSEVESSRRWCLAFTRNDGVIVDYIDKKDVDITPKLALAGYYHLLDGAYLLQCVQQSAGSGETQLSDILRRYGLRHNIRTKIAEEWFDFGNIDNLVSARRRLLRPRHFNRLSIDPVLNTLTKVSENSKKLQDELNWYLEIPEELKVLTPRIVSRTEQDDQVRIIQEYYGYPTLAELYLYGDIPVDVWQSILQHVFRVQAVFRSHTGTLSPEDIRQVYLDKTLGRIEGLRRQSPFWEELLQRETIIFNGQKLCNMPLLGKILEERIGELVNSAEITVIHGDFCFSNILFDLNNQIIRLIDPRGSFGQPGIYGDARYDIAKLRHSVCGMYDFIVGDIFEVREQNGEFVGEIYATSVNHLVSGWFDSLVAQVGYNVDHIRLIEALLFISMTPLHVDYPKRQLMMYLTGLNLLNQVLQCAS